MADAPNAALWWHRRSYERLWARKVLQRLNRYIFTTQQLAAAAVPALEAAAEGGDVSAVFALAECYYTVKDHSAPAMIPCLNIN